ncbi:hypothetical protein AVEN_35484-1 [Araneus ventricosus]|uniref:Tc1-like transposase DDE domain-containing protein n=1 Tax=Araneus ventricosus TaxID=182803 RepID=A0A4Y2TKR3_ARAVE|nr:hypothetical protein AVEN_35484-1 [Araneus ventricosus]
MKNLLLTNPTWSSISSQVHKPRTRDEEEVLYLVVEVPSVGISDPEHPERKKIYNTQNCRIWATENPFGRQPVPLHSEKVTVWYGLTASFIVAPFFFKEVGPVTCTVTGVHYESLLRKLVIPTLQQRASVCSTIFMQDGAPPHNSNPV